MAAQSDAVSAQLFTLAEYLALPEQNPDGSSYELSEGKLIPMSPTARPHAHRIDRILRYLYRTLDEEKFNVLTGRPGFILKTEPKAIVRSADIAVMHYVAEPAPGMPREAPILAIEIVSPSNQPDDLETKRRQYLAAGTAEVWIVYDQSKTVHVSSGDGAYRVYQAADAFESVLGIRVEVGQLLR